MNTTVEEALAPYHDVTVWAEPRCEECATRASSSKACPVCGSAKAGYPYVAHGRDHNNARVHFDLCFDCYRYLRFVINPEEYEAYLDRRLAPNNSRQKAAEGEKNNDNRL